MKLNDFIDKLGISIRKFSKYSGIPYQVCYDLYTGRSKEPKAETLFKIRKATFGLVDVEDFVEKEIK